MHRLLEHPAVALFEASIGRDAMHRAIDAQLDLARAAAPQPDFEALLDRIVTSLEQASARQLLDVVNATGILIHTNLGRTPLAASALDAARRIAAGYSNLEYDLDAGERGSRYERVNDELRALTGAQDALVVNNCAAAMLLILDTFAKGREVIAARGELIEIGGGFRLPDVLARSGATLVEIGATNKAYLADVERALSPQTALLLRSHTSNYRIEGFTQTIPPAQLAQLGQRIGVPVVEDLGSGAPVDLREYGAAHERTIQEALADGLDLVAFSGDKLLGGPQAGIIVGRASQIARLRANPLLRALRVDKATLAMLAETLRLHRTPESRASIPLYAMLALSLDVLKARARRYCEALPNAQCVETTAMLGGGSLPGSGIASIGVRLATPHAALLAQRLRLARPAIVARIEEGAVLLDLRTISAHQDAHLLATLLSFDD